MKAIAALICVLGVASVVTAGIPPVPTTPAAVDEIVYARPFTLSNGFAFTWCQERPTVTTGTLVVLKVDRNLVIPRQCAEPVLYVGDQTAERINFGDQSGYVIAIVPGTVDLTKAPIWFGTKMLPEDVTANVAHAERAAAEKAGIQPMSAKQVQAALSKGGSDANVVDKSALLREVVAGLILEYSPQESYLAEAYRAPMVKTAGVE